MQMNLSNNLNHLSMIMMMLSTQDDDYDAISYNVLRHLFSLPLNTFTPSSV